MPSPMAGLSRSSPASCLPVTAPSPRAPSRPWPSCRSSTATSPSGSGMPWRPGAGLTSGSSGAGSWPTGRPRPPVRSSGGASVRFQLPAATTARVRGVARELGGTVHMVLMTAFQALLSELSGQERFTVGTAVAGRGPAAVHDLIGFFANTLPVRADCSGSPAFAELFTRVRRNLLRAYAHQDLPLDQIVQAVRPRRDPGRTPLFQAIITYGADPLSHLNLTGLTADPYSVLGNTAQCDLNLQVLDVGKSFEGIVQYSTDLFDPSTADDIVSAFVRLVERHAS